MIPFLHRLRIVGTFPHMYVCGVGCCDIFCRLEKILVKRWESLDVEGAGIRKKYKSSDSWVQSVGGDV